MQDGPSMFSLAAAALYCLVIISCLFAGRVATTHWQEAWHLRCWLAVAAIFVLLVILRVFNLEEIMRDDLRVWLTTEGLSQSRRAYQGVIIATLIALSAAVGLYLAYWVSQRISGRRNIAVAVASSACIAMLTLILLRIVSLHALDALLFGPLKLNWFGDLGTTFAILGSAVFYVRHVQRVPEPRKVRDDGLQGSLRRKIGR